jgi:hypothetical protein
MMATAILLAGCASNTYLSVYKMRLSAVDRQERGSVTAASIPVAENAFDDGAIRMKWTASNVAENKEEKSGSSCASF